MRILTHNARGGRKPYPRISRRYLIKRQRKSVDFPLLFLSTLQLYLYVKCAQDVYNVSFNKSCAADILCTPGASSPPPQPNYWQRILSPLFNINASVKSHEILKVEIYSLVSNLSPVLLTTLNNDHR
jgi:hypothetical protein